MTATKIIQRMNIHRKCQAYVTKTLPERKDIVKGLPSKIDLTIYLPWRLQVLNMKEKFFLSPFQNQGKHYGNFFGIQKKRTKVTGFERKNVTSASNL